MTNESKDRNNNNIINSIGNKKVKSLLKDNKKGDNKKLEDKVDELFNKLFNNSGIFSTNTLKEFLKKYTYTKYYYSQIGIKNHILKNILEKPIGLEHNKKKDGDKEDFFLQHNRLIHSFNCVELAKKWFEKSKTEINQIKNLEKDLLQAVFLHDMGHMPTSHSAEEIFQELNWQLPDSKSYEFRHDEAQIDRLMLLLNSAKRTSPKEKSLQIDKIGNIMAGISGFPSIDMIVNSPVDVDKIEYIFRDTTITGRGIRLPSQEEWFDDFLEGQHLTKGGFISLNGRASEAMLSLLIERQYLYENFYLHEEIRAVEYLAKEAIKRWLIFKVNSEYWQEIENKKREEIKKKEVEEITPDTRFKNGEIAFKIFNNEYINWLESDFLKNNSGNENSVTPEFDFIVKKIIPELEKDNRLSEEFKDGILKYLKNSQPSEKVREDLNIRGPWFMEKNYYNKIREIARYFSKLFSGKVFVDVVKLPSFLSYPETRKFRDMDGKEYFHEVCFVPSEKPYEWKGKKEGRIPLWKVNFKNFEKNYCKVILFTKTGESASFANMMRDYFLKLLRDENIEIKEGI